MARKTGEELNQIQEQLGINRLWSWSRVSTYTNDPYEYLLKYILKVPEDRNDSIYAVSGNACHDILEKYYKREIKTHEEMLTEYEDRLFEFNTMGLMYERSDKEKNEKIADKYESCVKHFFLNHQKITNKPIIEQFILINVGEHYFQGYVDFISVEERVGKKKVVITDWKTSSIYKGEKLLKESGQLLLYGEGIHQKMSIPYDDIIIRFNFMKYVNVVYTQKKDFEKKERQVERNAIGSSLKANAKIWLKHFGYDEQIEEYQQLMEDTNGIECLPKEVQDMYEIGDCYVEVELNEDIVNEHKNNVIQIIEEIIDKEEQYAGNHDRDIFWKDVDKSNSYYFANLSGYSATLHKPYKRYLDQLDLQKGIIRQQDKEIVDNLDWLNEFM